MSTFGQRRRRLLSAAGEYGNVVVMNPKNIFYLTDFWGGAIGVVREEETVLVVSAMEKARATALAKEAEVVSTASRLEQYEAARKLVSGRALADEPDAKFGKADADPDLFLGVRRSKDQEEMARITKASRKIEGIYELLEKLIRPGRTEREVAAEVMKAATAEGLSPLPAEGGLSPIIIASGKNGAFPHAELTDRKIRTGEFVVADIFFRYQGYCSDCTRTYAVGSVTREMRDAYGAVLEAQRVGSALAKRGASGRAVHEAVRDILGKAKLDQYFTHGTGHGVGIDIHESPSLGRASSDRLREGDVVTVEPGVYVPEKYGIRIEDTLALASQTRNLFRYPKDLLSLG